MNALVRKEKQEANKSTATTVSGAINDVDQLENSLTKLSQMLTEVNTYVQNVLSGKVAGDSTIGEYLNDALTAVPRINTEQFDKDFNEHLKDLLMVIYLSNLMRTQLSIAEKLTNTM